VQTVSPLHDFSGPNWLTLLYCAVCSRLFSLVTRRCRHVHHDLIRGFAQIMGKRLLAKCFRQATDRRRPDYELSGYLPAGFGRYRDRRHLEHTPCVVAARNTSPYPLVRHVTVQYQFFLRTVPDWLRCFSSVSVVSPFAGTLTIIVDTIAFCRSLLRRANGGSRRAFGTPSMRSVQSADRIAVVPIPEHCPLLIPVPVFAREGVRSSCTALLARRVSVADWRIDGKWFPLTTRPYINIDDRSFWYTQ